MRERICNFVPQESIKEVIEAEYAKIKNKILELVPEAEVEHVGSSAVSGMSTKKDLDITVRVRGSDFQSAIEKFKEVFVAEHEDVWVVGKNEGLAIFKEKNIPPDLESVDIMLVIKDSRFDEFHIFKEILIQRELPACKGGDESQIPHLPV